MSVLIKSLKEKKSSYSVSSHIFCILLFPQTKFLESSLPAILHRSATLVLRDPFHSIK